MTVGVCEAVGVWVGVGVKVGVGRGDVVWLEVGVLVACCGPGTERAAWVAGAANHRQTAKNASAIGPIHCRQNPLHLLKPSSIHLHNVSGNAARDGGVPSLSL